SLRVRRNPSYLAAVILRRVFGRARSAGQGDPSLRFGLVWSAAGKLPVLFPLRERGSPMRKSLLLAFLGLAVALPWGVVPVRGGDEKPDQVKGLIDKLKDKDDAARLAAIGALANLGPKAEAAVPALVETLATRNEDVKLNAALALGRIGKPAAG